MSQLSFKRGDTWSGVFTLTSNGEVYPLDGISARMQLRTLGSSTLALSGSTTDGELSVDLALGTITFRFPDTDDLSPGDYEFDLELTDTATGDVISSETQPVEVVADVTRPDAA